MFYKVNWIKTHLSIVPFLCFVCNSIAQTNPDKVSHAEPLYFDLVRDLGARKGEREFNAGVDIKNVKRCNEQEYLIEYEFAPVNCLGVEVEADFSYFRKAADNIEILNHKLECLKLSTQYSFFVSRTLKTTLAIGYTQIIDFEHFNYNRKTDLFSGAVYSPFFIAAKRWNKNLHTLVYASPLLKYDSTINSWVLNWQINTSFLCPIPGTVHFTGVELNHEINKGEYILTIRPQIKIKLSRKFAIGAVAGVPINKSNKNYGSFLRIIYEP